MARPPTHTPPQAGEGGGHPGGHLSVEQQMRMREEELARPRSYSSGAQRMSPVFHNWKHKKAMEHVSPLPSVFHFLFSVRCVYRYN